MFSIRCLDVPRIDKTITKSKYSASIEKTSLIMNLRKVIIESLCHTLKGACKVEL